MGSWNHFLWPLIVLADERLYTLPVALANLAGEHVQDTELMMAGAGLTVLPVLLLFVFLQRYYVAGIMSGGGKEESGPPEGGGAPRPGGGGAPGRPAGGVRRARRPRRPRPA